MHCFGVYWKLYASMTVIQSSFTNLPVCVPLFSPGEVRSLWAQLRRDEPHLLSNFEEFLARVTHQIKEAHQEKKEMESALQRYLNRTQLYIKNVSSKTKGRREEMNREGKH